MVTKQTVTKNSVYVLGSTIIQKSLTLLYFILVARSFGPLEQGRYSTALAFTTFFGVFIDWGLSAALVRETSRSSKEDISSYAGQMLLIRLILGIIVYGTMISAAILLGYSYELISLIVIAGIASVIDVITTSCWAIMRGLQNLWYEAVGGIIAIGTMIIIGSSAILFHQPVTLLVIAVLCGSIANLIYVFFVLLVKAKVTFSLIPRPEILKKMFLFCVPFAGAAIFSRIYTFGDTTLVARLASEQSAGFYAAGNKLVLALNMIPAAISASIYPAMSAHFGSSRTALQHILGRALFYLFMVVAPLATGIGFLAEPLVLSFYGDRYLPTIGTMQLLMPGLIFSFLMFPLGALIAATNKQRINTIVMGIAAATNFALNIYLIPRLASYGAAITFSTTYMIIFILSAIATREYWQGVVIKLFSSFIKIISASSVMGLTLFAIRNVVPLPISIIAGGVLYIGVLFITKCISKEMLKDMMHTFSKQ